MLLVIALLCLATAVFLLGEVASMPARERTRSMKRAANYGIFQAPGGIERLKFRERVLIPAASRLASVALRLNPRTTLDEVSLTLMRAGLSRRVSPTAFLAAKGLGAVIGLLFGIAIGSGLGFVGALFFGAVVAAGGFSAPGLVMTFKQRGRREELRAQLPDALDLLAVSVEAGMGFDGAIDKLTEHMEGALAEEFALTLGEMRIGESRQDALKKLADRCETPEVATFTRAIIQADQLGISLGRILRVQAADTRLRRQAAAEEKAMKAPIKMLFPTVAFIFPAMFIAVLGPAFLNLFEVL
jgi:tight adherence protein C